MNETGQAEVMKNVTPDAHPPVRSTGPSEESGPDHVHSQAQMDSLKETPRSGQEISSKEAHAAGGSNPEHDRTAERNGGSSTPHTSVAQLKTDAVTEERSDNPEHGAEVGKEGGLSAVQERTQGADDVAKDTPEPRKETKSRDQADEENYENGIAALRKQVERLRKSEASSRRERKALFGAMSVKTTDFALINECEDLRANLRLTHCDLEYANNTVEVMRVEAVEMKETLSKARSELRSSKRDFEQSQSSLSAVHGELKAVRAEKAKESRSASVEIANLKDALHVERERGKQASEEATRNSKQAVQKAVEEATKKATLEFAKLVAKRAKQTADEQVKIKEEAVMRAEKNAAERAKQEVKKAVKEAEKNLRKEFRKQVETQGKEHNQSLKEAKRSGDLVAEGLRGDLEKSKEELKRVQGKEQVNQAEIRKLKGLIKKAETANAKARKQQSSVEERNKELEGKVAELERELETAKVETTKLQAKLENIENEKTFELPPSSLPNSELVGLISPAPLRRGRSAGLHGTEDMASESRSRFTDNLPSQLEEDARDDNDDEIQPENVEEREIQEDKGPKKVTLRSTPRMESKKSGKKRKRTRVISEDSTEDQDATATESLRNDETGARGSEEKPGKSKAKRQRRSMDELPPKQPSKPLPRKQRTKVTLRGAQEHEVVERAAGGRQLRKRKRVSYDYDQEGRDIVNAFPGFEVDNEAFRKPISRKRRSPAKPPGGQQLSTAPSPVLPSSGRPSPSRPSAGQPSPSRKSPRVGNSASEDRHTSQKETPAARRLRRLGRLPTARKSMR